MMRRALVLILLTLALNSQLSSGTGTDVLGCDSGVLGLLEISACLEDGRADNDAVGDVTGFCCAEQVK